MSDIALASNLKGIQVTPVGRTQPLVDTPSGCNIYYMRNDAVSIMLLVSLWFERNDAMSTGHSILVSGGWWLKNLGVAVGLDGIKLFYSCLLYTSRCV